MKLHGNARTCPNSRRLLVDRVLGQGWSVTAAAAAAGVSERTVWRWLKRFREEGERGLLDRSSRPQRSPTRLPPAKVDAIEKLRRLWMTAAQIAEMLGLALSTVSLWLKRIGLGRRSRLEPPEPPNRYERRHPGELVHVDIKTLGRISERGAGWRMVGHRKSQINRRGGGVRGGVTRFEYVHVAIDDHSRLAYAEVLDDLDAAAAIRFLGRAVGWFAERGISVKAVMTDNGSCYRSFAHRDACRELGLKHLRIKPGRPRTNGKAERFIQTLKNEWAYARLYGSSDERATALSLFLNHYNFRRPHGSLGHRPPASRLTNLVGNYN
ncbi:MAG TPA: IS481 family transposase [Solirubrobacteraceae bacterium]|nr:IS481 family transposase [Solirubrobacteraceae bacterium]